MILSQGPTFNSFYRAPRDVSKLVSQIANVARQNEGLDTSYIFKTVKAIAFSPWNQHILYDINGYENYGFEGPQYTKIYSLEPLAAPGTGNNYPVIWIPDPDQPLEPEQIFEPQSINDQLPEYQIEPIAYEQEPLPADVVAEMLDTSRETLILEPLTQEAMEIAMANPALPTEIDAELIDIAYALSENAAAILESPYSTPEQKAAAVMEISDLALAANLADPETIEQARNEALMAIGDQALQAQIQYSQVIDSPLNADPYQTVYSQNQDEGEGIGLAQFTIGAFAVIKALS